jgi:hypothetical protein
MGTKNNHPQFHLPAREGRQRELKLELFRKSESITDDQAKYEKKQAEGLECVSAFI